MKTTFAFRKQRTGICVLGSLFASSLVASRSAAMPLLPAHEVSPFGTSVSARPELAGIILADDYRSFAIPDGAGGYIKGRLQDRVTRSTLTGTLIFEQQVVLNAGSSTRTSVLELQRTSFRPVVTDVDYKTDGLGTVGSTAVQRGRDGSSILFKLSHLISPGESTYFQIVLTNATSYGSGGRTAIRCPGLADFSVASFQPTGTPQPFYTATPFGYTGGFAFLNDKGQVSMSVGDDASGPKALLWNPSQANGIEGSLYPIPKVTGFLYNTGMRINNRGQVAGTCYNRSDRHGDGSQRAYLWTPTRANGPTGTSVNLGVPAGGTYSNAWGINDLGQVTGNADYSGATGPGADGLPYGTAMLWSSGTITQLLSDGSFGCGYSINRDGAVAGYGSFSCGTYQGFKWVPTAPNGSSGLPTSVDEIGGTNYCGPGVASDINDHGVVVGSALFGYTSGGATETHGYIWDGVTLTDLGLLEIPYAINNAGVVVGSVNTSVGTIYRRGHRSILSYFVSIGENWQIAWASDVNTSEQIVGVGTSPSTGGTLLLMTPVKIATVSPASVPRGSAGAVITINGTGFRNGAEVLWGGASLTATRLNSKQLRISVPASWLLEQDVVRLQVINPDSTYSSVGTFAVTL